MKIYIAGTKIRKNNNKIKKTKIRFQNRYKLRFPWPYPCRKIPMTQKNPDAESEEAFEDLCWKTDVSPVFGKGAGGPPIFPSSIEWSEFFFQPQQSIENPPIYGKKIPWICRMRWAPLAPPAPSFILLASRSVLMYKRWSSKITKFTWIRASLRCSLTHEPPRAPLATPSATRIGCTDGVVKFVRKKRSSRGVEFHPKITLFHTVFRPSRLKKWGEGAQSREQSSGLTAAREPSEPRGPCEVRGFFFIF